MPAINPDNWHQAKEIFYAALQRPPAQRERFLDESCAGDPRLRAEVESLLSSSAAAGNFMLDPAVGEVAESFGRSNDRLCPGEALGHYRIISQLGEGGMGEVFLAEDTRLRRRVAVKVLPENIAADKGRLHRFEQEANAASALNHPNILTVHEFGFESGVHFLASEFVDGKTLREAIEAVGAMLLTHALNIAEQTSLALSTAHASGIIHRDIKPENIMIRRDGIVKVVDFGLAKLIDKKVIIPDGEAVTVPLVVTSPGVIMGTASYMSPEQARGKETDARTDTFSLGVVLYEMLTGHLPFPGETATDSIAAILTKAPPPLSRYLPDAPPELQRIVHKALTKKRDDRYQTARDLMTDLKALRITHEKQSDAASVVPIDGKSDIHSTSGVKYPLRGIKQNKLAIFGLLFLLLLGIIAAVYWFYPYRPVFVEAKQIKSIAILPFENGSGDANLDYLSDGLSESLIDNLSQLPQLKVIARNSSFKYRGQDLDLQRVANALGVQAIVTGRVVRRDDKLTIRVEMVDARENRQLWSQQYDRLAAGALAVPQEIAKTVSEKLRLKLSGVQEQQLAKQQTTDPQAFELLLKGIFYRDKAGGPEYQKKALEYFQQSITVDPKFALGYAELSYSYTTLFGDGVLDPNEFIPSSKAAAHRAVELDEDLAEAHMALACVYLNDWDWPNAESEFQRATQLNPNLASAHDAYSFYLSAMGRHDEAIAESQRARELNPASLNVNISVAAALTVAGRYEPAIEDLKQTLQLDENYGATHRSLGFAYMGRGMYSEAITEFQDADRLEGSGSSGQVYLGAAYALAGKRDKAQEILKQLTTSKEYASPAELAILYVSLGDRETALASLEKVFAAHDLQLQYLKIERGYDPIRGDPRFQDLLRRVGLPA